MDVNRSNVEQVIADRLDVDPQFRDALLEDPHAALQDLLGREIPSGVRILVHQESPGEVHLVIPAAPVLDDADLELVAGGTGSWSSNCQDWPS